MRATRVALLVVVCIPTFSGCEPKDGDSDPETASGFGHAVIVKAAGTLPGEEPADHPDAITEATTETWNTHAYADRLALALQERGVDAVVVDHLDCEDLACVQGVPEAGSNADLIVFAGATMNVTMPEKLQHLIAPAAALEPAPRLCSALTSSGGPSGETVVAAFVDQLSAAGLDTVPGAWFASGGSVDETEVQQGIATFADSLTVY
jgi:hypothetical protein